MILGRLSSLPPLWPGSQSAADLAIWQGATSVCQLCHKYTAHRAAEAFMMSLPRGLWECHDIIMPRMIGGNTQVVFYSLTL